MKVIYSVVTTAYNGTVEINSVVELFATRELAEKAKEVIDEKNKNSKFLTISRIKDAMLFENEEEIPCFI